MIEGIDIFTPRDNGLPDFTRISPAQIFNGSVAASLNAMKERDPYGLLSEKQYTGEVESPWKTTTIDQRTGKRVEVRKASVVPEMLSKGPASGPARRGHRPVNYNDGGGGVGEPDLPQNPEAPLNPSLLDPGWHPPMALPAQPVNYEPAVDGNIPLPPIEPGQEKTAALRRLPTMLLEELKNLHLV